MRFHPYSRRNRAQWNRPREIETPRDDPPGGEVVWTGPVDQAHTWDKYLLDSGYMSDCTVICGNVKWRTHKDILCSRNSWFSAAFDGRFKEAMTGVVTIEDTDPDMVQMVLNHIYTGETKRHCSTPTEIIHLWKAADFFRLHDVADKAKEAMQRRLKESRRFLSFNPDLDPESIREAPVDTTGCEAATVVYGSCGHSVRERRACAVRSARPVSVFHLCEPGPTHRDRACGHCQLLLGDHIPGPSSAAAARSGESHGKATGDQADGDTTRAASPDSGVPPARPDYKRRAVIEDEIRALCEALAFATAETRRRSWMQEALIDHLCNTRVAAWGGFAACRFLEA